MRPEMLPNRDRGTGVRFPPPPRVIPESFSTETLRGGQEKAPLTLGAARWAITVAELDPDRV